MGRIGETHSASPLGFAMAGDGLAIGYADLRG
jgi:hypothetical protein